MLLKILRLFKGSVFFSAEGGFFERFLNLCSLNDINLQDVKNDGVKLTAFTSPNDYKRIKSSAKKSGMKVRIIRKSGLPFFIKHNKMRVGAVLGVAFAASLLVLASLCVWNTEIEGIKTVKAYDLTKVLEHCNIKTGAFKSKIDTEETEKMLTEKFPQILWVSVNIYGSKVQVEIREKDESPKIEDYGKPSNLVASKDGRIILVKGFTGTNKVREGDVVVKGDILVSGVTANGDNTETLIKATGEVFAQTQTDVRSECALKKKINTVCEAEDIISFEIFGLKIPYFAQKEENEVFGKNSECLKGNNENLPLQINWKCFFTADERDVTLTDNMSCLCALCDCIKKYRAETNDTEVSSLKFKKQNKKGKISVDLRISGTENIAKETDILIDDK